MVRLSLRQITAIKSVPFPNSLVNPNYLKSLRELPKSDDKLEECLPLNRTLKQTYTTRNDNRSLSD